MKISCQTNLDDIYEEWPTELPFRPMVGDLIQSKRGFELEVVQITIDAFAKYPLKGPELVLTVELHIPKYRCENISDFTAWYKRHKHEEMR
jgi:hypothetical protein